MPPDQPQATVVGAGPAGMTAAVALARRGVDVTVHEAEPGLSPNSRASTFHPPTLELLRTLGVYEVMAERGLRAPTFQYRSRRHGVVAELDLGLLAGDTDLPFRLQLEQNKLTRILADELASAGGRLIFNHALADLTDRGDHVELSFEGAPPTERADWVLGADGASSTVRRALGLDFVGTTYEDRFLVVTTAAPLDELLPGIAPVNYVSDADEWLVLLQIPGAWRVLLPVRGDADPTDVQARKLIASKLDEVAPGAGDAEVVEWSLYRVHQRVASQFRVGRTLLLGDAAHVNSPIGGMGMNSGIHDAFAVTGVLADVLDGRADEVELDRVADQRRRFAEEVVQVHTDRNTRNLALADPEADARRRRELAELAAAPDAAREHLLQTSMIAATRELVATVTEGN